MTIALSGSKDEKKETKKAMKTANYRNKIIGSPQRKDKWQNLMKK